MEQKLKMIWRIIRDKQVVKSKVLEIEPASVKDIISKDKLSEEDLINLRGLLNIFSDRYERKLE